ncbi:B box and SPRY domain-containing protein isoform X1 [Homo sapiens]|uniref:B box and SPRY domain-containing protein isoform X1 n=1 Tax=Homo sapiens TaxID=9606 RepID=UPI0003EAF716|nr:B box and SPRY domain-containing protein isoform X1 [Homo sapiens]XP_054219108.1 B box and SPRY domain-containing protein isoform X1 [Homo sapiens]|eukprot:XP_006717212.1 B box and SPRY domain-containing protein isoform X1 [Homo sapiens]
MSAEGAEPGPGSGSGPGPGPLCPEHGQALSWFCGSERRPVCAACAGLGGRCRGHRIRRAEERAEELRNKIVDQCERLQLQSAAITKYVADVLPGKNQRAVSMASAARELVIQRLSLVRSLCESEEQRLLEQVHGEEERAHQSILTQRVHWAEALQKLDTIRTGLVGMLTHLDDLQLIKEQEIFERTEEAEGILDPQESEMLNFNEKCTRSPLLTQLWATAVLGSLSGTEDIRIDERTVSPFLQLSDDRKTLTFSTKKSKACADGPERFDHWPNALAATSFQNGLHAWMVNVQNSCAYKVGVASGHLPRKGSGSDCRLGHNAFSWVFSRYDQEFRFSHNGQHEPLGLLRGPAQLGVVLDLQVQELLFYEPASGTVLCAHHVSFPGPLFPVFAVADQTISIVR